MVHPRRVRTHAYYHWYCTFSYSRTRVCLLGPLAACCRFTSHSRACARCGRLPCNDSSPQNRTSTAYIHNIMQATAMVPDDVVHTLKLLGFLKCATPPFLLCASLLVGVWLTSDCPSLAGALPFPSVLAHTLAAQNRPRGSSVELAEGRGGEQVQAQTLSEVSRRVARVVVRRPCDLRCPSLLRASGAARIAFGRWRCSLPLVFQLTSASQRIPVSGSRVCVGGLALLCACVCADGRVLQDAGPVQAALVPDS
jgi:hypothetical protein